MKPPYEKFKAILHLPAGITIRDKDHPTCKLIKLLWKLGVIDGTLYTIEEESDYTTSY